MAENSIRGDVAGMNKTRLLSKRGLLIVAIAAAAIAWGAVVPGIVSGAEKKASAPAGSSQDTGTLAILRSANLGTTVVGVSIDGVQTAKINFNGRYDAPIAVGQHVLTSVPIPNREHAAPAQTRINVQKGKTYTLTAVRADVAVVLK